MNPNKPWVVLVHPHSHRIGRRRSPLPLLRCLRHERAGCRHLRVVAPCRRRPVPYLRVNDDGAVSAKAKWCGESHRLPGLSVRHRGGTRSATYRVNLHFRCFRTRELDAERGDACGNNFGRLVCTGNICRSPFIECVLRLEVAGLDVVVESAGTSALVGESIDPYAQQELRAHGADPSDHAARQLTAGLIEEADLVLTAARRHRSEVAVMSPRALRYAFAWGDFAELVRRMSLQELGGAGSQGWPLGQVVAAVAARRGSLPPRSAPEVDIVDPYRHGRAVFERMGQQVMSSLPDVVRALRR